MKDILELMEERYSVRSYRKDLVEQGKLDLILRAAQVAPTAVNRRPQRIYVLRSAEALEKAASVTRFTFGAPLILLICSDTSKAVTHPDGQYLGTYDAAIATTQMMLEAWDLGIGSCWVRGFDMDRVSAVFGLPPGIRPEAMLTLGYPSGDSGPSRTHGDLIAVGDMVTYL